MKDNKSASLFQKEQVMEKFEAIIREAKSTGDDKESNYVYGGSRNGCHADCLFPFIGYFGIWSIRI